MGEPSRRTSVKLGDNETKRHDHAQEESVHEDDICNICHLLLLRPIRTQCAHTFCEECFSHWADVSINQMTTGLDIDEPMILPVSNELEARCPMCRASTTATLDNDRTSMLRTTYPSTYATREEEFASRLEDEQGVFVEQLTLNIGNAHRLLPQESGADRNRHEWRFFVRTSRTDIIEEIHVFLHPTFPQPNFVLQSPPYAIEMIAWGVFPVTASIVLKAGYSWVSPEAEDTSDGAVNGKLPLEWMLDFNGSGSQGRLRLKIKKQKDGQEVEDEMQNERTRRLWTQQRLRDPDFVPED